MEEKYEQWTGDQCTVCMGVIRYDEGVDSYFCKKCDEWKVEQCTDPDCYFCPGRPDKPSNRSYRKNKNLEEKR